MQTSFLAAIEDHYRETASFTGLDALSERVREALATVDRRLFVPAGSRAFAERDAALPIGCGQTISQPFIVALMTQLLALQPYHRVLEIGTGSGYQGAVLAQLAAEVYSIEVVEPLAEAARERFRRLGYGNIEVYHRDGWHGLPEQAPFDAIIITAAVEELPPPLLQQLRPGGRLVAPVGPPRGVQQLTLTEYEPDTEPRPRQILPVGFVPFSRDH